jgi:hypothetical protein
MKIQNYLKTFGMDDEYYLNVAKSYAGLHGYEPKYLSLATDNKHKLRYKHGNKHIQFGSTNNLDYIILTFLEGIDELTEDVAFSRRHQYLKRSEGIKGDWKEDKFSPNNLARKIIWNE